MELIAHGVPVFKGHIRPVPHASDDYQSFYATAEGNDDVGDDRGDAYKTAFTTDSFRLQGPGPAEHPWETLEQPSMQFCYGTQPGTITLNHWVAMSGNPHPMLELRDPGVLPREVDLSVILERLIYLENGFEEDYPELMYKNLYKNLLRDPDKYLSPHKAMEKQIADLIIVLSRPDWTDFSKPENQVVAKFFANATYTDHGRYKTFFHQLLLSMELDLRINSKHHVEWAKEKLLSQLPPCIAWDLALARKWRGCMTIEKFKTGGDVEQSTFHPHSIQVFADRIEVRFHLKAKTKQVKALRKFARAMKWPSLAKVDDVLKECDPEAPPLEDRSSDTMSYFTGMILPGVTMPWLVMNSLIDCDDDTGSNDFLALTHMHPNSGFQYKGTTYWSATSIVGKVLAPTCKQIAGWIGPARPAPDLGRLQIARIWQRKPKQRLTKNDIDSMTIRSDPLGPPSISYPVAEYILPRDNHDKDVIDTIRIEKLALKPISSMEPEGKDKNKPLTYDAAVQFAIDGRSWPLRLSYDVSFISAFPCAHGPHVLFHDYIYKTVNMDEILSIRDWGNFNSGNGSLGPGSSTGERSKSALGSEEDNDKREKVLVVQAGGVGDCEVLARAWCSHWGLGAVIADLGRTW
jgi:hypothetical protein